MCDGVVGGDGGETYWKLIEYLLEEEKGKSVRRHCCASLDLIDVKSVKLARRQKSTRESLSSSLLSLNFDSCNEISWNEYWINKRFTPLPSIPFQRSNVHWKRVSHTDRLNNTLQLWNWAPTIKPNQTKHHEYRISTEADWEPWNEQTASRMEWSEWAKTERIS